ncbi:YqhA family protein [Escherichia coli]|uniref:YqhA family protein n=1 Tax=Escherichia coli TaxID=562 RepID=UPI00390C88F1
MLLLIISCFSLSDNDLYITTTSSYALFFSNNRNLRDDSCKNNLLRVLKHESMLSLQYQVISLIVLLLIVSFLY